MEIKFFDAATTYESCPHPLAKLGEECVDAFRLLLCEKSEVAYLLDIAESTLDRWVEQGKVPGVFRRTGKGLHTVTWFIEPIIMSWCRVRQWNLNPYMAHYGFSWTDAEIEAVAFKVAKSRYEIILR